MRKEESKIIKILILVIVLFFLDRISKFLMIQDEKYVLTNGVLWNSLVVKHPIAFSLFLLSLTLYLFFLYRSFGIILIMIGGFSNLVDRLLYGGVVDYWKIWFLPVFNIADLMIILGSIIFLVSFFKNFSK